MSQLRKRLNEAFKDFARKVEGVARKNGYSLEFDIPYRDLGFMGNPNKEMVTITPTLNCLCNLTETPFFVVDLSCVDHVHFERITFMSKAFDMVMINKDFTKQPWRVDMIPNEDKDSIQVGVLFEILLSFDLSCFLFSSRQCLLLTTKGMVN